MNWFKVYSCFLFFLMCACATTTPVEVKKLPDDSLNETHCNSYTVPMCLVSFDDHIGFCYTSGQRQNDSIDKLHERFLINYNKLSGEDFYTRNMMSFSSKGVILSCEMMSLFDSLRYKRDSLALHELQAVIGGSASKNNENLYDLKSFYSENTDLSDLLTFKRVLLAILTKMKENDRAWRRDWK